LVIGTPCSVSVGRFGAAASQLRAGQADDPHLPAFMQRQA
jgi:hypothetical protein